jgi:hypothetical protein
LLKIETATQHDYLYPEGLSQVNQTKFLHLSPARPRIADQDRMQWPLHRHGPTIVVPMKIPDERSPPKANGNAQEHGQNSQAEQRPIAVGSGLNGSQNDKDHTADTSGNAEGTTWHPFGHGPPEPACHHGQADQGQAEKSNIVHTDDDECHDNKDTAED